MDKLLADFKARAIALVTPAMVFGPPTMLVRSVEHHLDRNVDYTRVLNLPRHSTPEIYSPRVIGLVASFAKHRSENLRIPDLSRLTLALALQRPSVGNAEAIKCSSFAPDELHRAALPCLPEAIDASDIAFPETARRVFRVWNTRMALRDPLSGMVVWKKAVLERDAKTRREFLSPPIRCGKASKMKSPLAVLSISTTSGYSGAEEALCTAFAHCDKQRLHISTLLPLPGKFSRRLSEVGTKVLLSGCDLERPSMQSLNELFRAVRAVKPNVIHVNGVQGEAVSVVATLAGIPIVHHARVHVDQYSTHSMRFSSRVIAVSKHISQVLARLDIDPLVVRVVYDGIDTERFDRSKLDRLRARAQLGIAEGEKVILMVARYAKFKRHDLMVDALSLIHQRKLGARLILVGETFDPRASAIRQGVLDLVAQRGLRQHVTVLGFQEDIRDVQVSADLLVLCSDEEPLGVCALEAMSLKVPVVVTAHCGVAELIRHEHSGFIVKNGDAESLAQGICSVLAHSDLAYRLGENGRDAVMAKASAKKCSEETHNVLVETAKCFHV